MDESRPSENFSKCDHFFFSKIYKRSGTFCVIKKDYLWVKDIIFNDISWRLPSIPFLCLCLSWQYGFWSFKFGEMIFFQRSHLWKISNEYHNFLWTSPLLGENQSHFISPNLKLHNQYYLQILTWTNPLSFQYPFCFQLWRLSVIDFLWLLKTFWTSWTI